jgi:molybdopterin converting factor subunit 1
MTHRPLPVSASPPTGHGVRVRLFASLSETAGWSERRLPLTAPGCTACDLWRQLQLGGQELPVTVRVAINQTFASPHTSLRDGDELAFLPPISGG